MNQRISTAWWIFEGWHYSFINLFAIVKLYSLRFISLAVILYFRFVMKMFFFFFFNNSSMIFFLYIVALWIAAIWIVLYVDIAKQTNKKIFALPKQQRIIQATEPT